MPEPVTFRHAALTRVYAAAREQLAALPLAEREALLATIGTSLLRLDRRTDLAESQLRLEAERVVAAQRRARLDLTAGLPVPEPVPAMGGVRPIQLAPAATLDATDGMPLLFGRRPRTAGDVADALYAFAAALDRTPQGERLARLGLAQRRALLDRLETVLAETPTALPAPQAAQQREAVAALLRELLSATVEDQSGAGCELVARALRLAAALARAEQEPILRDAMVFSLYRLQTRLPEELRDVTRELVREAAPLWPAYAAWLGDGRIAIDFVVDGDAVAVEGTVRDLEGMGFEQVGTGTPPLLRGSFGEGEKKAVVEITVRRNSEDIFANINRPEVDIVWFSGHANYGRAFPTSLANAVPASGKDKLVVFDICFGKDNMQQVRRAFPEVELMATFESATLWDSLRAMRAMWEGIAERQPWKTISETLGGAESGNWVTPAESMLRRRILDRDHDGRADLLDRLYDVNLQRVEENLRRAFEPIRQEAPPHRLQCLYGATSAGWLNRGIGGYNDAVRGVNAHAGVVGGGFFDGGVGDPPVVFSPIDLADGHRGWRMSVNANFAHMPEAVLRAVAAYQFSVSLAELEPGFAYHDDPVRARVNGLLCVAFTLSHDMDANDEAIWKGLLAAFQLPESLDRHALEASISAADDEDAGGAAAVDRVLRDLGEKQPDVWAKLTRPEAGCWPVPQSPKEAGLPEAVYVSALAVVVPRPTHATSYYCKHTYFLTQRQAQAKTSTVVSNDHGEPLVGFLHVPADASTRRDEVEASLAERHVASREVVGAALTGFGREAMARVGEDPIRILLTGFGRWEATKNNPTGDFVTHAENLDAAMQHAFGTRLLSPRGEPVADSAATAGRTLSYRVRDGDGRERMIQVHAQELAVADASLDPESPGSVLATMKSFAPHAVLCMGVRDVMGSEYFAETFADSSGLRLGPPPVHDPMAPAQVSLPPNYALARALLSSP
jgi:hypothetical protein